MKIISLFAGAGGLDLGFRLAGFDIIYANEFDKDVWETYTYNHPTSFLDKRDIRNISAEDIPECDGIIGGPPCQSWSEAGSQKGINDSRGQLFFEFIRIVKAKKPKFFLAENVPGMLLQIHKEAFQNILDQFDHSGYNIQYKIINASDYSIAQDRKRLFIIGYRKDLKITFQFPEPSIVKQNLNDAIGDLVGNVVSAKEFNISNEEVCSIPNHEYMIGGFSAYYMARNRVRSWNEASYTILASGRHAPMHPQAPKMKYISQNRREFIKGHESLYRRLSVRECARIQSFPDDFIFYYQKIIDGYKMVGNAVPPKMAERLASVIMSDMISIKERPIIDKSERIRVLQEDLFDKYCDYILESDKLIP